jgi:hypothetical protein
MAMSIPHPTQDQALHLAETLLREHGFDLEITLHLDDDISPPPSIWFNKKRMRLVSCWIPTRPNLSARSRRSWPAVQGRPAMGTRRAQACLRRGSSMPRFFFHVTEGASPCQLRAMMTQPRSSS